MSEVKVNKISPRSGTTVTLGDSGDTFTIPSGATINNQGTAVNFGATGSASWSTTVKTGDFTAVAGEGYFVDTTSGEIDVTLPAGTAGAVVAISDYAKNFNTNKVTLVRNGSDKIGGESIDATLTTQGIAVTLIYIDSTKGWIVTDDGLQSSASTAAFIVATGGTITQDGNYKVHTFTGPGTFTVCSIGTPQGSTEISYMVVAGGGGGGAGGSSAGGGGAGGFREGKTPQCTYTSSPLACTAGANNGLPVTATGYPVTVGGGGALVCSPSNGNVGTNSVFAGTTTITSAGGGYGGRRNADGAGGNGGSGGGAGNGPPGSNPGGAGNTPSTSPPQGNNGGGQGPNSGNYAAGAGGGAGAVGGPGSPNYTGNGGDGVATEITGSSVTRAGGGGGQRYPVPGGGPGGCGGAGGGGNGYGGGGPNPAYPTGNAGTANTGGGGAGAEYKSGAGGSGIVVIRYRFQ